MRKSQENTYGVLGNWPSGLRWALQERKQFEITGIYGIFFGARVLKRILVNLIVLELIGELLVCNEGYFRWFIGLSSGASIFCSKLTYFAFSSVLFNIGPWLHGSVLFNSGAGKGLFNTVS